MTILLLETIDADAQEILGKVDEVILASEPTASDENLPFDKIQAIVTRGLGRLDKALMQRCPRLKVIARCGAGLDNVDTDTAARLGVPVIHAPGVNAGAVAEHTMMLILALQRQGLSSSNAVKNNHWNIRNSLVSDDVQGKTLGIVGFGRVGQKVAGLADAFGIKVVVFDPFQLDSSTHDSLEELLSVSDIVTLHLPLTEQSLGLMDAGQIAKMKSRSILVNTSRGEIVVSSAVVTALDSGHLAGYGADVVDIEPPPDNYALTCHPQTMITPHVASLTQNTYRKLCVYTAENLAAVLTGGVPEAVSVYRQ
jgi:D-3-phosphoglycerate dehydrogenase